MTLVLYPFGASVGYTGILMAIFWSKPIMRKARINESVVSVSKKSCARKAVSIHAVNNAPAIYKKRYSGFIAGKSSGKVAAANPRSPRSNS